MLRLDNLAFKVVCNIYDDILSMFDNIMVGKWYTAKRRLLNKTMSEIDKISSFFIMYGRVELNRDRLFVYIVKSNIDCYFQLAYNYMVSLYIDTDITKYDVIDMIRWRRSPYLPSRLDDDNQKTIINKFVTDRCFKYMLTHLGPLSSDTGALLCTTIKRDQIYKLSYIPILSADNLKILFDKIPTEKLVRVLEKVYRREYIYPDEIVEYICRRTQCKHIAIPKLLNLTDSQYKIYFGLCSDIPPHRLMSLIRLHPERAIHYLSSRELHVWHIRNILDHCMFDWETEIPPAIHRQT